MWTCSGCGHENDDRWEECLWCKAPRPRGAGQAAKQAGTALTMPVSDSVPSRYGALRAVADAFKVLGWLTVIICGILGIIAISAALKAREVSLLGLLTALAYFVAGAIGLCSFYATAQSIIVIIDIEENTRATRSLTQRTLEVIGRVLPRPGGVKD